jgi:hypothetical protein
MLSFERHEQTAVDALDFRLAGCDAFAGCGVSLRCDVYGKSGDGVIRLFLSSGAGRQGRNQQEDQWGAKSFHGILLSRVDERGGRAGDAHQGTVVRSERKCLSARSETLADNLPAICGGLYSWRFGNARNLWAGEGESRCRPFELQLSLTDQCVNQEGCTIGLPHRWHDILETHQSFIASM